MADQTTIYDIVTRYRIEDGTSRPLEDLDRRTQRVDRSFVGLNTRVAGFGRSMLRIARYATPLVGIAGAFAVVQKTTSRLNEEMERTLQLSAQFNLAFRFSAEPAEQFEGAMRSARNLVRQIIADAARLPGESSDFFQIAALTAGPIFKGGGGPQDVRRFTSNLAIMAPFAAQTQAAAARQSFRILSGQTNTGDNPLFQFLQSAPGLNLPQAGALNALPVAERFRVLDKALATVAENPFFRKELDRLLATQMGTLSDLLFGPQGIGGQLGRAAFGTFVDGLSDFNASLKTNTPIIVGNFQLLAHGIGGMISPVAKLLNLLRVEGLLEATGTFGSRLNTSTLVEENVIRHLAPPAFDYPRIGLFGEGKALSVNGHRVRALAQLQRQQILDMPGADPLTANRAARQAGFDLSRLQGPVTAGGLGPMISEQQGVELLARKFNDLLAEQFAPFEGEPVAGANVNQTFNIKIDLKSDDSPEGIAIKFRKAIGEATRSPTSPRRALPTGIGPSAVGP